MTRQAEHNARKRAEGCRELRVRLTPEAAVALAQLKARGAKSDAAAVNAAVVAHEEATRPYNPVYHPSPLIMAIKAHRERFGSSLRDARDAVEAGWKA